MDKQKVYNIIKAHAIKQNERAIDGVTCQYRSPDGLKCFIGAIIPDELYNPDMEGSNIESVLLYYPDFKEFLGVPDLTFLIQLQNIHDWSPVEDWIQELKLIANEYHLIA